MFQCIAVDGMTAPGEPRWLTDDEMQAWLPLIRLVTLLPQVLDRQLRDDAGLAHVQYLILARLSMETDRQLRMSELATRVPSRSAVSLMPSRRSSTEAGSPAPRRRTTVAASWPSSPMKVRSSWNSLLPVMSPSCGAQCSTGSTTTTSLA